MTRGLISPPRSFAGSPNPFANLDFYMSESRRSTPSSGVDPSEHRFQRQGTMYASPPRTRPSRRRPTAKKNTNDLQNLKKLDNNNSSSKTTAKITSSRPSSAPTRPRNGFEVGQPRGPTPITNNSTAPKLKAPIAANNANLIASKFSDSPNYLPSHGSGHPQRNNHLQKLSTDGEGEDVANIVPHENSKYKSVGKDMKKECSSQSNALRIFQIYKDFAYHRQENSSITSYFTKLKTLWDELENYSDLPQCYSSGVKEKLSEHVEREKVMQLLVGLNDSYSAICRQILLTRPLPTVEKAYSVIIQEEKQRELTSSLKLLQQK